MRATIAIACFLSLSSCGDSPPQASDDLTSSIEAENSSDSDNDPDDTSEEEDNEEKGGETYPEYDQRRDSYDGARGSYLGQGCTVDCSGHEAGYAWAEEKGITDPDHCGGRSWSFIEGCQAYAKEQQDDSNDESDDE